MVKPMHDSTAAPERVRTRFEDKAQQFDDLYEDERWLVRTLRPGLFRRRKLAVDTVAAYAEPRVLDVGCGSGRIGEFVLEAGACALRRRRLLRADDRVVARPARTLRRPHATHRRRLPDRAPRGPVRGDPRGGAVRLPARATPLRPPHVRAVRTGRLRGRIVPDLVAAQGAGTQGPLRVDRQLPDLQLQPPRTRPDVRSSGFERVEIASPGRSGYLVRAYRTRTQS